MMGRLDHSPPPGRSLSARLLALTVLFVMLAEVFIYAPSIGRYRKVWLEERIESAHLAALALEASPDLMVDMDLQKRLLSHAGVFGVYVHEAGETLMLGPNMPMPADADYDLREATFFGYIADAFVTLVGSGGRVLKVTGRSPGAGTPLVEILVPEAPMRAAMLDYSARILALSLFISGLTATLVYFSLHRLFVEPMRRLTACMLSFRQAPEDAGCVIAPSDRSDEIGVAEHALAEMQNDLRGALTQKARLAALGMAVTKIHHDLRGILSSAMVVSERLEKSGDPEVRRLTPTIVNAIDRAVALCTQTMTFAREGPPVVRPDTFALRPLVEEVGNAVTAGGEAGTRWRNSVPSDLELTADRDLLFRALSNVGKNAVEAGAPTVTVEARMVEGWVELRVADDGPGLPPKAREHLFMPFAGSARAGGTGLGLAIARELVHAQGGDIMLDAVHGHGTAFRLRLPARRSLEAESRLPL